MGGSAAVYSPVAPSDYRIMWIIHELQSLGYQVVLYTQPEHADAAHDFLARAAGCQLSAAQRVQAVPVAHLGHGLAAPPVKLFFHLAPPSGLPHVMGRGSVNVLLVASAQPKEMAFRGGSSHVPHAAAILATYDYLLYTSSAGYVAHISRLMPTLQQLQLAGSMFPLVDIINLPAAPLMSAADAAVAAQAYGVTLSMSVYRLSHRGLLVRALQAFATLAGHSPVPTRLILCTSLVPGLESDRDWLTGQLRVLGLARSVEHRGVSDDPDPYSGISVQWHLYNQDAKPHFTALAAMPGGVYVIDCTGTLATLPGVEFASAQSPADLPDATMAFMGLPDDQRAQARMRIAQHSLDATSRSLMWIKVLQIVHRSLRSKVIRFFMQQTQAAYQARMTPATQRQRNMHSVLASPRAHNDAIQPKFAAVIVETRPHYAFLYVLLNAAWYLPGWSLHVVHSRVNAGFVRAVLAPYLTVTFHQLDADNVDIDDYNNLMKNASFWRSFGADQLLLFQTDSLILKPGIERFAEFDYIGAPWHLANERWSQPALKAALPDGVGNGGFSLRSTKAMVYVCEEHGAASPLKEQEDIFFATHIQRDPGLRLGDRQSAYNFCLEVPCADLAPTQHYALHAAWYYNDATTMQQALSSSLFDLVPSPCVR